MSYPGHSGHSKESSRIFAPERAAGLFIVTFVACQFIDIVFFSVGGFAVSVPKIALLFVLPWTLICLRTLDFDSAIVIFGVSTSFAFSFAHLYFEGIGSSLFASLATVLPFFVASITLFTCLKRFTSAFRLFMNTWVICACVSAVIATLQAVHLVPLFTVNEEVQSAREAVLGLYRGVGLKFDPNFEAMCLMIAFAFSSFLDKRYRIISTIVIVLGIIATFSRMGLLFIGAFSVCRPFLAVRRPDSVAFGQMILRGIAVAGIVLSVAFVTAHLAGPIVWNFVVDRFDDVTSTLTGNGGTSTSVNKSSAEERASLADRAIETTEKYWLTGVGLLDVSTLGERGPKRLWAAHDTFLEMLKTGGVYGVLPLAILVYTSLIGPKVGLLRGSEQNWGACYCGIVAFWSAAVLLSLTTNIIFWLPVILGRFLAADTTNIKEARDVQSRANQTRNGVQPLKMGWSK